MAAANQNSEKARPRSKLPVSSSERRKDHSVVFSLLKRLFVGMDVVRFSLPLSWSIPVTWSHRQAEQYQAVQLLKEASSCPDPIERMTKVVGFFIPTLSNYTGEANSLFTLLPVLGETFEVTRADFGFRLITETVEYKPIHHASFAESVDHSGNPDGQFRVTCNLRSEATFHGKTTEIHPDALYLVELPQHGEVYKCHHYSKVIIGNYFRGITAAQYRMGGSIEITLHKVDKSGAINQEYELKSVLTFHTPVSGTDWLGGYDKKRDAAWSEGYLETKGGERPISFYGAYQDAYFSVPTAVWEQSGGWKKLIKSNQDKSSVDPFNFNLENQKLLWKKLPICTAVPEYFMMSEFLMQMNEKTPESESTLPPTDCRFRKDCRYLENGEMASAEKAFFEIEDTQKRSRQERIAASKNDLDPWVPAWFRLEEDSSCHGRRFWRFTGEYWQRDWSRCTKNMFT